ncbi:MAG: penicillin-binding protein, partial [Flavitalea sp.]
FFKKVFEDKTLGLDKQAKFVQPENMKSEMLYDYMNIQDQAPPPGAEGVDAGNSADEYLGSPDANDVPVESKLSLEEQKILQEAGGKKKIDDKVDQKGKNEEDNGDKKKKKGFFKRLFGKKDKNQ